MNPDMIYQNLIMGCNFAAYNEKNRFTDEQRKWLSNKMNEAALLPLSSKNPFVQLRNKTKFKRIAEEFEAKYLEWSGDIQLLKDAVSSAENVAIPFIKEFKSVAKALKGAVQ